ncbi:zinc finger, BED-type, Phospholipase-like, Homeodomain-like protein [Artemisia annua]|uniref:Zinc finger, BED-type, Phospholipase-like, Homeodomain-like protein n=1 Tax=Artemisia annua TaxID=35608 RepID=A0A2U1MHU3_ARTAN|nr:zinc finger, BED-type, Phospholipase-like, Homeodomain-like protein [Artemisia annua]
MPRRNQASQSQPTSSNNAASQAQGSTNQPYEVSVEKITRNQEIWCHFDMVRMSDSTRRARCKACNTYINADGNSTLKKHTNNHCKATKGVSGSDQNVMGRDWNIFQSGNKRYVDYIKLCHTSNSIFLSPNWDVPTRWNSTYNMFVCGLRQKLTLQHFHDELCRKARRGENLVDFIPNAQDAFKRNFKRLYDVYFEKYGATNVGTSSMPNMWASATNVDLDLDLFSNLRQESGKRARSENLTSNEYG